MRTTCHRATLAALLLALGAALFLWSLTRAAAPLDALPSTAAAGEEADGAAALLAAPVLEEESSAAGPPEPRPVPAEQARGEPVRATRGLTQRRAVRGGEVRVHGDLCLRDAGGSDVPAAQGRFLALLRGPGDRRSRTWITVSGGSWSFPALAGARLSISSVWVGGTRIDLEEPVSGLPIEGDTALSLRGPMPHSHWLRVVDAASGRDLDGLEVVSSTSFFRPSRYPSGTRGEEIARDASSPVLLRLDPGPEPFLSVRMVYVRSPGYAWQGVRIEPGRDGETLVALHPGGDLEVLVLGELAPEELVTIAVREHHDSDAAFLADILSQDVELDARAGAPVLVRSLWPGSYVVHASDGSAARTASALVRVETGSRAACTLQLPGIGSLGELAVVGAGSGWGAIDCGAVPLDAAGNLAGPWLALEEGEGELGTSWSALVPAGDYAVVVDGQPGTWPARVQTGARTEVRLELPARADVRVRLVDAQSGRALRLAEDTLLRWQALGDPLRPALPVQVEEGSARLAEGPWLVRVFGPELRSSWEEVTIEHGSELTLRVEPTCSFELILEDESGAAVPWPPNVVHGIDVSGSDGEVSPWMDESVVPRFFTQRAGTLRVRVPPLSGFRPVPPFDVVVSPGPTRRHVVVLERWP